MSNIHACTVCVPASTSNLGPGFDTLGLALQVYNRVRVSLEAPERPLSGIFAEAVTAFYKAAKRKPVPVSVRVTGDVPMSCGLGSSATVRLGILLGLNHLFGQPLSPDQLLITTAQLEGHPDNATPALHGGFIAASMNQAGVRFGRFEVPPKLKFVTVIPDFQMQTEEARKLLPKIVHLREVVSNLNNSALIVSAFAKGDYELLRGAFDDRLHQPYRKQLIPQLDKVIAAGESAGALGGFLSGSGSAIICATLTRPQAVVKAMRAAFESEGVTARSLILTADNNGAFVEKSSAKG